MKNLLCGSRPRAMVTAVALLASAAMLSACGGGDDDNPTPPATQQVPTGVNTSVGSFISYLQALIASAADMLEPVDTSKVTPAVDDTAEPTPVN